ncbi:phytoene/squalene synthase family protein [Pseudomonas capeferrum]|uniref:phytoene/squalene synthase family protein n=1 Tax=Pseudomonas capeferrum TaxID=1495066 RepID=UPI0015E4519D|nr:phytoene/squalene synthase family protein [Pseudomonas capeferrum]MBA1204098.1 phytoene/squalene synthase family protein [Pseudomonas capeferrum]
MSSNVDQPLLAHAEQSIAQGSKSFAAASRLFDPRTRRAAVMLYAWCRHCDDVIDGQESGHDATLLSPTEAGQRLARLREQTRAAYTDAPLHTPAFQAFRQVASDHGIPADEALDLLQGFEMDVNGQHYETLEDTLQYCYHVAGVVGLMMGRVMGVRDAATLDRACDLGLGMQLTNIARDIIEDAQVGRCYLPQEWLRLADIPPGDLAEHEHRTALGLLAGRLVEHAEPYYASAEVGLAALPWRSAWAVATAASVYRQIGLKVQQAGQHAWDGRISTSKPEKLAAVLAGLWRTLTRRWRARPARSRSLWQRPDPSCARARHAAPAAVSASGR